MGTRRRLLGVFVVAAIAVTSTSSVHAQPAPAPAANAAAEDAKHKGDEAMVALRYEEALGHYRGAYEATRHPAILYNMGRAHEGLGNFPKALEALEEFADKAPPELKARVPKLEELLREVRARVSTLVVSAPLDDAEIRLGERIIGKTRAGQVIVRVNAGRQRLTVTKEGYFPFEKDVELPGGKIETADAQLTSRSSSGLLRVTSPVAGAAVSLDDKPLGIVPAESAVTPGSHKISLQRDGYEKAETSVVLAAGERRDVDVPMAKGTSIFGTWWFWTAVGVVAAGGVATVVALTSEQGPDSGTIAPGRVTAELRF